MRRQNQVMGNWGIGELWGGMGGGRGWPQWQHLSFLSRGWSAIAGLDAPSSSSFIVSLRLPPLFRPHARMACMPDSGQILWWIQESIEEALPLGGRVEVFKVSCNEMENFHHRHKPTFHVIQSFSPPACPCWKHLRHLLATCPHVVSAPRSVLIFPALYSL